MVITIILVSHSGLNVCINIGKLDYRLSGF